MLVSYLGLPGAGKSWLARQMKERLGGTIVAGRHLAQSGDAAAFRVSQTQDKEFAFRLRKALLSAPSTANVILDGIPRTPRQAKVVSDLCGSEKCLRPGFVFSLEMVWPPQERLPQLLLHRLVCDACGEAFDLEVSPPRKHGTCDHCAGGLSPKSDMGLSDWERKIRYQSKRIAEIKKYLKRQTQLKCVAVAVDIRKKQRCSQKILARLAEEDHEVERQQEGVDT